MEIIKETQNRINYLIYDEAHHTVGSQIQNVVYKDDEFKQLVDKTESILATYLPDTMFKVRVNHINIPIQFQTINVNFTVSLDADLGEISGYIVDNNPISDISNYIVDNN